MGDKFVLWKQNLATKIGKKTKILISIFTDFFLCGMDFFCKYKHPAYKYHLWFWNFKLEKISWFNKLHKKNNARNGDEINLVSADISCSSFSDLSVKCCSTSVKASKNESIQRFEMGAVPLAGILLGWVMSPLSSWSVKLLDRSVRRCRYFVIQKLMTLNCTSPTSPPQK